MVSYCQTKLVIFYNRSDSVDKLHNGTVTMNTDPAELFINALNLNIILSCLVYLMCDVVDLGCHWQLLHARAVHTLHLLSPLMSSCLMLSLILLLLTESVFVLTVTRVDNTITVRRLFI